MIVDGWHKHSCSVRNLFDKASFLLEPRRMNRCIVSLILAWGTLSLAFTPQRPGGMRLVSPLYQTKIDAPAKGFGKTVLDDKSERDDNISKLNLMEIREQLLDLLPRMTGKDEEFRQVEALVNALEARYHSAQTLSFLNLAMQGEWQLLFSTNLSGTPNPSKFRLRELFQRIDCKNLEGQLTNEATWDLAEAADANFEATGSFVVKCSYQINQGARMVLDLDDHLLQPSKGSAIPQDVQGLVGLLHRSMPKEMFDPSDHAIDTTYLDGDLRIVRYTGPRLEGVRDIFIRRGALEINPANEA